MARSSFNPDIILSSREMQSCFLIAYANYQGTAFLFIESDRVFFLTAKHNVEKASVGDNILIMSGSGWLSFPITGLWHDSAGYDASAFTVDNFTVHRTDNTHSGGSVFPGEPIKFLGFPHGLVGNYPGQGYPTPLVRTAYFSGVIEIEGLLITMLDGFNNPGYSGGPVYLTHENKTSLFGMISAYRVERESHSRIFRRNEHGEEESVSDYYTKPNSGMILSVGLGQMQKSLFPLIDGTQNFVQLGSGLIRATR